MKKIYLSERQPTFQAHKTLLDNPFYFENSFAIGCIFYLSPDGQLGGDTFLIQEGNSVVVSLLGDMEGHGALSRKKLTPILQDLEKMVSIASQKRFNSTKIIRLLSELDEKTGFDNPLTISLVRLSSNGVINYLNEGENELLIYKGGQLAYRSLDISHGKVGWLNLTVGSKEEIIQNVTPCKDKLMKGDKILICSDGVFEYTPDSNLKQGRLENVGRLLTLNKPLTEIVKEINRTAESELRRNSLDNPVDDYTIVGLEVL